MFYMCTLPLLDRFGCKVWMVELIVGDVAC